MGDDNTPRIVKQLFQGKDKMVRITPTKENSFIVNINHILSLKFTNVISVSKRSDGYYKDNTHYRVIWYEYNGYHEPKRHSKTVKSYDLALEFKEEIIGTAEVRAVFRSPKFGAIAGCMVTDGLIKRSNPIRVLRNNVVIYTGELESLRRIKDDVNEVRQGFECGIGVKNYNDVKEGDQIEVYERVQVKRTL